MSYHSILDYLLELSKTYLLADKNKKSELLNHAELVTQYNRKSIIRLLKNGGKIGSLKTNCGAKAKYPQNLLLVHIKYLWIEMDRISAKRMKAAYKDWLPYYHDNEVTNHVKYLLQKMSASTLGRFLKLIRSTEEKSIRGLTSTVPAARHMQNKVPINTLDSTYTEPGFFQTDTVAHCGTRLEGVFINSITLTDIFSTWTVNTAILSKKGPAVRKALNDFIKDMPFKVRAINTDSGSEFLNMPVYNMITKKKVMFTRSRPYKKNDNCYVEQKNYTHVRELFGYYRLDDKDLVRIMNDIYENYWNPLLNFFLPTFKLKEKIRVGGRIKKKYGPPETPYKRLMESDSLSDREKYKLSDAKKKLNPFVLKKELNRKLAHFFKVVTELEKLKEREQ